MEPPNKKPRTNDESPDILHSNGSGHGSKSTKLKLQSVNNSVHDLSSSPASAPERWDDLFSNDLHAGQDDTRVVIPPKKLQSPWDTPDHSLTYVERVTSHAEMVMSDDEDSFTKDAAKQRRCEADYYGEDVEIRQSRKVNSARKMPTSTSTIYAQEYARSPSRRRRELDKIIPDSLLRAQPDDHSSPDVIQDAIAFDKESNPSRHVRAIKGIASSANVAPNTSMRTSGDYENPGHVKLYRTKQMLFGSALDVSGYVLAVDRSTHSFSIDYDSTLLNQDSIVSNIRVDRIHKVIHGEKGPKVKITTANIPGIGHEILLELTSHKLVCELSLLLQNLGHGISSETESDDRLDKMFLRASTNAKKHTAAKCKVVARTDETATVSPYFGSTTEHNGTDRVLRRNGTHKREYSSLDSPGGFDHPPAPRERRSPAARGRTELQEDYKERDASAKLNRESTLTEASASRSRNTRLTSTFRSPPPPPPLKYSQTGKLGQPWEKPLRYPINGKKKATVEFDDLSRLDDEEFLNDNLIAFFLRYLEHHLEQEQPDLFKRSYFFNSYFYEKLRQKPPDKKSVINYVGVKKWTDKISLFNRDFIVVPVNENLHWYLAIICNLSWFKLSEAEQDALEEAEIRENALVAERELATENAQDTQKSLQELSLEDRELHGEILVSDLAPESSGKSSVSAKKKGKKRKSEPQLKRVSSYKPAIITLDSLGMPRYSTVSALKHYIAQEASARLDKEIDMADIHGIAAKKIPLQSNYSDCGLFVCAYLERFVVDPTAFVKQELGRIPQQWPKMHSHDLRSMMRDFIVDLHKSGEGGVSEKPIPSVGEILLPPVTSPRPAVNGRLEDEGIEDSTFYDPPTSPIVSRGRRAREDEQREAQEHDSGAEENDINSGGGNGPQHFDDGSILNSNGHASGDALGSSSGNSLRARTAKLLSSPIIRHSNIVPESDSEPEMISPPRAIDHPSAMAKGMREERSLKALRKIRSTSSNLTDFLEGHESYQDHGTGADDDHEMLLE
jgi:sentrin-specific protease 7